MIILAIDALEYEKVIDFNCVNLMQEHYGKTNISEFSQPRTMVLWSSFMTGENKENAVLKEGNKEMWNTHWPINETFFSKFKSPVVLDLPGFSYDLKAHEQSRELLKAYFITEDKDEKEKIRKQYNKDALKHHKSVKAKFLEALDKNNDLVLGYFSVVDVIGHLNFGNTTMMKIIYQEFDDLAAQLRELNEKIIILSDHGMKAVGKFGDHSNHGFWSTNFIEMKNPKITDFRSIIEKEAKQ